MMKQNTKIFLLVGAAIFMFIALIAGIISAAFYFHIFNLANIVSGGN
jgi:hypothetical protein